jgi:phosphate transport system permease protein
MTERHADSFDFFYSPQGNDTAGDGSSARPFATLGRTVSHIQDRHVGPGKGPDWPGQIEIIALPRPGADVRLNKKPRYQYYIDPVAGEASGDGSELMPWPNLSSALESIEDRHGSNGRSLAADERIRVVRREVFTSTAIEHRKRRSEAVAKAISLLMTLALVVPLVGIFGYLIFKAWPALSLSFVLENPRRGLTAGGIWAPLVGTFYLVFLSLLAAAPIGVLAGVYLNEYATDNWFTRMVQLAVVNLAGVPSIVHALFGVGAFVALTGKPSVIAASLTLAVMTLPVIITSTKEALASVPMAFREACWNMGATRWQTIRTIVLPNSIGGILTGVILQVSRAAGETAPILFTGAVLIKPRLPEHGLASFFPYQLNDSCMALSNHLYQISNNVPGVGADVQYGTAVVLIALVLIVNSLSIALRTYLRSRKRW